MPPTSTSECGASAHLRPLSTATLFIHTGRRPTFRRQNSPFHLSLMNACCRETLDALPPRRDPRQPSDPPSSGPAPSRVSSARTPRWIPAASPAPPWRWRRARNTPAPRLPVCEFCATRRRARLSRGAATRDPPAETTAGGHVEHRLLRLGESRGVGGEGAERVPRVPTWSALVSASVGAAEAAAESPSAAEAAAARRDSYAERKSGPTGRGATRGLASRMYCAMRRAAGRATDGSYRSALGCGSGGGGESASGGEGASPRVRGRWRGAGEAAARRKGARRNEIWRGERSWGAGGREGRGVGRGMGMNSARADAPPPARDVLAGVRL